MALNDKDSEHFMEAKDSIVHNDDGSLTLNPKGKLKMRLVDEGVPMEVNVVKDVEEVKDKGSNDFNDVVIPRRKEPCMKMTTRRRDMNRIMMARMKLMMSMKTLTRKKKSLH